jgi:hypothetical protein
MIENLIPDEVVRKRVIIAVCGQYQRPDKVKDKDGLEVDNPTSKTDFTNNILKSFLKEVTAAYEANKAGEVARQAAVAKAKTEVDF